MFVHHVRLFLSNYVPLCSCTMFVFLCPTMFLYFCPPCRSILSNNVPLRSFTMFVFSRPNLFLYVPPLWRKTLLFYVSSDLLKYRRYYTSVCTSSSYARTLKRITLAKVRWNDNVRKITRKAPYNISHRRQSQHICIPLQNFVTESARKRAPQNDTDNKSKTR